MKNIEELIKELDFEIDSDNAQLSSIQNFYLNEVQNFGIDKVYFSGEHPCVFLKKIDNFSSEENLRIIADIHKKAWNFRKVLFLYVTSDTEIRIYNCNSKPINPYKDEIDLSNIELFKHSTKDDLENLNTLLSIFSRIGVDTGAIWSNDYFAQKIDVNKRVDKALVNSLINTRKKLQEEGLTDVKYIHNLLIRSLFILYLEDKKATPQKLYHEVKPEAKSYFDILDDWKSTYNFFAKIEKHFNGNVFPVTDEEKNLVKHNHLKIVKNCFWDGEIESKQFYIPEFKWKAFSFDIIPIELLSEIYENFLEEEDKDEKDNKGTHYTPIALVELILNQVLPRTNIDNLNYKLKILDPACGSGIFLVEAYKRLIDRWKFSHPRSKISFEILKEILTESIFGVEINKEAVKVTAFSLYLTMLHYLEPPTLWAEDESKCFPYLINDKDDITLIGKLGYNLFRTNSILDDSYIIHDFDIIIGNPPFGKRNLNDENRYITEYCQEYKFSPEFAIPFLHKATTLTSNGKIAFVFPSKILTNTQATSQNFRNFIFKDCYVDKIYNLSILRKAPKNNGGNLFTSAVGPVSIIFYQKHKPQNISKTITYWAPKTYIKNHTIEGVVIDNSDIKYVPRKESERPNSKIWKVAMWGSMEDYELIDRLLGSNEFQSLEAFFKTNKDWKLGTGLHTPEPNQKRFIPQKKIIPTQCIQRYYTPPDVLSSTNKEYRLINEEIFRPPFIAIKEGHKNKQFCSSYIDYEAYCLNLVTGISCNKASNELIKTIVGYFNSKFTTYFLFLISSNWGIEREIVKLNEMLSLPSIINKIGIKQQKLLGELIDEIILECKNSFFTPVIKDLENKIDEILYQVLGISEKEKIFIGDVINYSLSLLEDGSKSIALHPTTINENQLYASTLCNEINNFLKIGNLKVGATVYEVKNYKTFPLNLIKLCFSNSADQIIKVDASSIKEILIRIDKYTLTKFAQGIYFKKHLKYYNGDEVYIIKPNQKRFWSGSAAINDANELISEILKM